MPDVILDRPIRPIGFRLSLEVTTGRTFRCPQPPKVQYLWIIEGRRKKNSNKQRIESKLERKKAHSPSRPASYGRANQAQVPAPSSQERPKTKRPSMLESVFTTLSETTEKSRAPRVSPQPPGMQKASLSYFLHRRPGQQSASWRHEVRTEWQASAP